MDVRNLHISLIHFDPGLNDMSCIKQLANGQTVWRVQQQRFNNPFDIMMY